MFIRYRTVPYGTSFRPVDGVRPANENHAEVLYANEAVADVGAAFWPADGAIALPIIDHHFLRTGQFPSAAAAVLHSAPRIRAWWERNADSPEVWLVTHSDPDFDAYASLFLIKSFEHWTGFNPLAFRMAPDSWRPLTPSEVPPHGASRFDWFGTLPMSVDSEIRWRVTIAIIASYSDACRPTPCPKTQTAPAILYAALKRGRDFRKDGAGALFEHICRAVVDLNANPLTDPIFEESAEFRPEVALLAREKDAYDRDIARARQAIVTIPSYTGAFEEYYEPKKESVLLTPALEPSPDQVATSGPPIAVDGIFLRDPECVLFKDLARIDTENSSMGRGFLFTAVANSAGRGHARTNQTEYYFALDPERADKLTLYPLWCRLQSAEIRSLNRSGQEHQLREFEGKPARPEYEKRASEHSALFSDPWFAGDNYRTTIVGTPSRGTEIGPAGTAVDLMDDEVTCLVRTELEFKSYSGDAIVVDYAGSSPVQSHMPMTRPVPAGRDSKFRFCMVPLAGGLEIKKGLQSKQIGEQLWYLLHPQYIGLPTDFSERHLTQDRELIAVWSRYGLAIAYLPEAGARVESVRAKFGGVVQLLEDLLETVNQKDTQALEKAENLLRDVAVLRQQLSIPGGLLAFRRFIEAIGFHGTIATGRDLLASRTDHVLATNTQEVATSTRDSVQSTNMSLAAIEDGNRKIELLEILFATFYSIELLHILLTAVAEGSPGAFETRTLTLVGALIAGLAAIGFLRKSRTNHPWNPLFLVPVVTFCVLILGFIATFEPIAGECRRLLKHETAIVRGPAPPPAAGQDPQAGKDAGKQK